MNSKIRAFLLFFIISFSGNIYGDCSVKLRTFLEILRCLFCPCCKKSKRVYILNPGDLQNREEGLKRIEESRDLSKLSGTKISLEKSLEERKIIDKRELEKKEDQAKDLAERKQRVKTEILSKLPGYREDNAVWDESGANVDYEGANVDDEGANGGERREELEARFDSEIEWNDALGRINFEFNINGNQEREPKSRFNSEVKFTYCSDGCSGGCLGGFKSCSEDSLD